MPLPTEFPLSAFQVRSELGIASNLSISMLSDAVRRLAAQNPPRNDVRFSELLGKSNRTPLFDVLVVAGGGGGAGRDGFAGGGGGGINVNVSVDAKGTSVSGDGGNSAALGKAIAASVQAELVKQKRPGGLLA